MLTPAEAVELSTALADAAAEGMPPSEGSLTAFRQVFGTTAPANQSCTAADLQRHIEERD